MQVMNVLVNDALNVVLPMLVKTVSERKQSTYMMLPTRHFYRVLPVTILKAI